MIEEIHSWNSGHAPGGRNGSRNHGGRSDLHDLASLLAYTAQDLLNKCGTAHSELCPPASTLNQEHAYKLAYRPA